MTMRSLIASRSRALRYGVAGLLGLALAAGCGDESSGGPDGPGPAPPPAPGALGYAIGYSTYLGGNGEEEIREPILLSGGRLLFGSRTKSTDIPTTSGAVQRSYGGGEGDSYLAIIDADGGGLEAATYFGGSGMERPPYGTAVAANGDVVFTSGTSSPDLPTGSGAYRPSLHSPTPSPGDGYVCRISGDLRALRWCTYTGGGWPRGGLRLDGQDDVWVAGRVTGSGFSTTADALQREAKGQDDAFLLQLSSDGSRALYSTRIGGSGSEVGEIASTVLVAPGGEILASGTSRSPDFPTTAGAAQTASNGVPDAFFLRFRPGVGMEYSTLFGGNDEEFIQHPSLLLPDGSVLAGGATRSGDLPSAGPAAGGFDAFLALLTPDGSGFAWVRRLGGSRDEFTLGPVVDPEGRIYAYGRTESRDLPTTANALQGSFGGGSGDGFLVVLSPDASQTLYATYLGGDGDEIVRGLVIGPAGEVYLVGRTSSNDFPVTAGALQAQRGGDYDGFVVKLVLSGG